MVHGDKWTHGRRITESHTAQGGVVIPTPQILISHALWSQWGEIAIERENRARWARAELLARHHHGQDAAPQMYAEFLASLVAISAAAHGLDVLYGALLRWSIVVGAGRLSGWSPRGLRCHHHRPAIGSRVR